MAIPEAESEIDFGAPLERCGQPSVPTSSEELRRITPGAYVAHVERVFGVDMNDVDIPPHAPGQYDNDAANAEPTEDQVQRFVRAAEATAERAMLRADAWMPCSFEDAGCAEAALLSIASDLFRRPLTSAEEEAVRTFAEDEDDGEVTVQLGLEALLMSPEFLYFGEVGDSSSTQGWRQLTRDELANRLSMFLYEAPASPEFRARLHNEEYATLVDELVQSDAARDGFERFARQWLVEAHESGLSYSLFPELGEVNDEDVAHLESSLLRFLEYAFFEASSLEELMSGSTLFVSDRLAPLLGVSPPGSDELVAVSFPEERAGVLTHPALLSLTSEGRRHSPTKRGAFVMSNILCRTVRPPPPDVDDEALGNGTENQAARTTRETLELEHSNSAACAGCHTEIDGIGFAFEHYDALGRYRETENDVPVDASGVLNDTPYEGALEFGAMLQDSDEVAMCIARHLFRYGIGRRELASDQCQLRDLAVGLREQAGDLSGLLGAFLKSTAFTHTPDVSEEAR